MQSYRSEGVGVFSPGIGLAREAGVWGPAMTWPPRWRSVHARTEAVRCQDDAASVPDRGGDHGRTSRGAGGEEVSRKRGRVSRPRLGGVNHLEAAPPGGGRRRAAAR
jgi:hypothetical protein